MKDSTETSAQLSAPSWIALCFAVVYIAIIGIFAIEEIEAREEVLRLATAQYEQVTAELAVSRDHGGEKAQEDHDKVLVLEARRAWIDTLRRRLSVLIIDGALPQSPATLREITCELAATQAANCNRMPPQGWLARAEESLLVFFLKRPGEYAASGVIFGILVVTASLGGALIRLSVDRELQSQTLRTMLRAIGGGIVCYLALDGGGLPMTATDMAKYASPASGSLFGLLAGMFSNKVFKLVSDLVDAFVARITPPKPSHEIKLEQRPTTLATATEAQRPE